MKKLIFILLLSALLTPSLFSLAVIKKISGKVEIKAPQEDWEPAKEGMIIPEGTYISTGFNSEALLDLGESIVQVKPLTRMQLEELVKKEGTVKTALYLRVGKIRAEVKTVKGLQHDFKLRGPLTTAAVRGTSFEYDGVTVKVFDGFVSFFNLLGQKTTVTGGEEGNTSGYTRPLTGKDKKESRSNVSPYNVGAGKKPSKPEGPKKESRGRIRIRWEIAG